MDQKCPVTIKKTFSTLCRPCFITHDSFIVNCQLHRRNEKNTGKWRERKTRGVARVAHMFVRRGERRRCYVCINWPLSACPTSPAWTIVKGKRMN